MVLDQLRLAQICINVEDASGADRREHCEDEQAEQFSHLECRRDSLSGGRVTNFNDSDWRVYSMENLATEMGNSSSEIRLT